MPICRAPLVGAESRQILGASFLGASGDEAIHCVLDTMYAKAPYTTLQRAMHIHPTIAEFIPTILGDLVPLEECGERPPLRRPYRIDLNQGGMSRWQRC